MTITPGKYLQLRREAAKLSIEDVASIISTVPPLDEAGRIAWLRQIEADEAPIGEGTILALRYAYAFDANVLRTLDKIRRGELIAPPQLCRRCACSWMDPCYHEVGQKQVACCWVADDLCSSCAGAPDQAAEREAEEPVDDDGGAVPGPGNDDLDAGGAGIAA